MLRQIVTALSLLLLCQVTGDFIAQTINFPIPGPVIGMLLLLITLIVNKRIPTGIDQVTKPLLTHMSLLFIPAGAGVILYVDLIAAEWPAIVVAIIISTLLALLTTAIVFRLFQPNLVQVEAIAAKPTTLTMTENPSASAPSDATPRGDACD